MTTIKDTVELKFAVPPQKYSVRRWNEACWEDVNAISEEVEITGDVIELTDGGYIYEVEAKWTGENTILVRRHLKLKFYCVIYGCHWH